MKRSSLHTGLMPSRTTPLEPPRPRNAGCSTAASAVSLQTRDAGEPLVLVVAVTPALPHLRVGGVSGARANRRVKGNQGTPVRGVVVEFMGSPDDTAGCAA